jgi:lipoprotein Spr
MKKIITNFLLLIFCSVPRFIKAQTGIDKIYIFNEGKLDPRFTENISSPRSKIIPVDDIEKMSFQAKYAMMLDVAIESIKNTSLYQFIESWYGTRYRLGGTTKKGIDCSAFTDKLLSAVYSLVIPRTAREQFRFCERISRNDLSEGDLVFFSMRKGVSHVGVYLANGRFVHSSRTNGVMISNLDNAYYSRRFVGGGRVNE